jgi:RNA polymerase sigma-70 factor (ECF subfamily)
MKFRKYVRNKQGIVTGSNDKYNQFERLTGKHWGAAFGLIYRIVNNKASAEDILQDTLVRAMSKIDQLRDPGAVKSWFLSIAHSTAINWMKKNNRDVPVDFIENPDALEGSDKTTGSLVEEAAESNDESRWISAILSTLPPIYREIIHLRYKEHLSYQELADTMKIPMSSVKFRLHQGIKLLKEKVKLSSNKL